MASLSGDRIAWLLRPYFPDPSPLLLEQLSVYLALLMKWNGKTNLTAIREPEEIVQRHFGESLFVARRLPVAARTLLDFGAGAGFPGLPIQLVRRDLRVTLAESQNKKATFLREVVRVLGLPTEVYAERAENLLATERRFDLVTLRAVDDPAAALVTARRLLSPGGQIVHLTTAIEGGVPLPNSTSGVLLLE